MGLGIDDILAYTTVKRVYVRDRHAGGLYYAICIAILAYIFGYELIYNKGYLAFQTLTGSVRGSMDTPPAGHRALPDTLSYCAQSSKNASFEAETAPFVRETCMDSGNDVTHFGRTEPGAGCMIGTRITVKPQYRNTSCHDTWEHVAEGCAPWATRNSSAWQNYFVAAGNTQPLSTHVLPTGQANAASDMRPHQCFVTASACIR